MNNFTPDTSELIRERDGLSSLITRIDKVAKIIGKPESPDQFIECMLKFGPLGPLDAVRAGFCFGFHEGHEIKFAMYRANRSGRAKFNHIWELEAVSCS